MARVMWLSEVAAGLDPGRDGLGCIIWPFLSTAGGYGVLGRVIDGKATGTPASRWLCEMINGKPPPGEWFAAHTCGRGKSGCVTPEHLEWKTRQENEADKVTHGSILKGERNGNAKLTKADIRAILVDTRPATHISEDYPVSTMTVNRIKRGKAWTWVDRTGLDVHLTPTGGRAGTANQNAKLTTEQVLAIRSSGRSIKELSAMYGTPARTISAIRNGHSRRNG